MPNIAFPPSERRPKRPTLAPRRTPDLIDSKLLSAVSVLLWHLEVRDLSALYKSDDEKQALRVIISNFHEPLHRRLADRVMHAWNHATKEGKTLADALRTLDDEEAWWIRCQLPTDVSTISESERFVRRTVGELWRELRHE